MTEIQYAEEALKAQYEFFHIMTMIKWILLSISIAIWALVLKQVPVWWNDRKKKKRLGQMRKDLSSAERPTTMEEFRSEWD
jgi:predicted membrane protein